MTAISKTTPDFAGVGQWRQLEDVTLTNQSGAYSNQKYVQVPAHAREAVFLFTVTSMAGTTPLLDFIVEGVNPENIDTTETWQLGDWDGITQLTSAAATVNVAVDIGPEIAADDTGSATASCRYGVNAALPPLLVYTITADGTTGDEDYAFTLGVKFQ